jgi:hypothetical protein
MAVMRIVAAGDMKAAEEAICQYAADVAACACMPLIEQNARLQVEAMTQGAGSSLEPLLQAAYAEGRKDEAEARQ